MHSDQTNYAILRDLWILQGEVYELLGRVRALIGNMNRRETSVAAGSAPEECVDMTDELGSTLDELRRLLIDDQAKHAAFDLLSTLSEFASETAQRREDHRQLDAALDDLVKLTIRSKIPHATAWPEIQARFRQLPAMVSSHLTSFIDLVRRATLLNRFKAELVGVA